MNSTTAIFIFAASILGLNSLSAKPCEPAQTIQLVAPPKRSPQKAMKTDAPKLDKPVWVDRLNGRKYSLPASIGGKPVSFYLKNPKVSPLAKALYTSHFRPTDKDSTTRLLALVTTSNQEIRPFYRWCLDFTIAISDGALGEYPGEPALAYAIKFPEEFFNYMDKDHTGERYKSWTEIIAYSGLGDYNGPIPATKKLIIDRMKNSCQTCSNKTSQRINVFANDITKVVTKRW